ncbi:Succinate receptor 1 G-protein coupled receptor 91 P2Y purinoceptor 1-like [Larimichthys crocea]|uniref:Succinate receptor 1 G-protein coupled receptor 91 P2Y purinoceptor 1-like n=1 Tax=Larimichthys crocea TaxID=215358 RepID=A0A6G0IUM8_LARCR|nr:Succinate receptor 1 G-protein coupled receptor 91 P2Y purinoceptor 1-like [Larimichthys crocea]
MVTLYSHYQQLLDDNNTMTFNCTEIDDVLEKYYLAPSYAIEFSIGFLGNLLVVLGYIFCLPEWQSCNIYIFSLALSDLIFLCTLPRLTYLYANGQKTQTTPFVCVLNRYILHVNLYSSILFMVLLSMDRFLLIRHPTRNNFLLRPRTAMIMTGLGWLAVNVEIAPMISLMVQDLHRGNWTLCKDFASLKGDIDTFGYSLGLTMTGYILPLLGLCGFSYQIAHLLRVQERALQRKTTSFKRPLKLVVIIHSHVSGSLHSLPCAEKCQNSSSAALGRDAAVYADVHRGNVHHNPTSGLLSQCYQPCLLLPHG